VDEGLSANRLKYDYNIPRNMRQFQECSVILLVAFSSIAVLSFVRLFSHNFLKCDYALVSCGKKSYSGV